MPLYCSICLKIQGFAGAILPIMTASHPVWAIMAQASSGERISPLPITGIFTACFTDAIPFPARIAAVALFASAGMERDCA